MCKFMNYPSQLATEKELEFVKNQVGHFGGGLQEAYIPKYEGPFLVPEDGDRKFWHLRFKNGNEGFNVGLILYFIKSFPVTWTAMLADQINAKPPSWDI